MGKPYSVSDIYSPGTLLRPVYIPANFHISTVTESLTFDDVVMVIKTSKFAGNDPRWVNAMSRFGIILCFLDSFRPLE